MSNIDIMKWAIEGIRAKIKDLEQCIYRGNQLLNGRAAGIKDKSPKTNTEIIEIIKLKHNEIEKLVNEKNNLEWDIMELE